MVTIISCYSFFFHSARIEISLKLDGVAKELGAILTLCTSRLDYESVSQVFVFCSTLCKVILISG